MIRGYIAWRKGHVTDPRLRKAIKRASTIKRAKAAGLGTKPVASVRGHGS
jgi:hypothetical protein